MFYIFFLISIIGSITLVAPFIVSKADEKIIETIKFNAIFIVVGAILTTIGVLGIVIPTSIPIETFYDLNDETSSFNIYSIGDGNNMNLDVRSSRSSAYIHVSTEGEYTYYYKLQDGRGYMQGKIPASNAVIIEDENVQPYIEQTRYYYTPNDKHVFWDIYTFGTKIIPYPIDYCMYKIFLPKGTIGSYNLDAST